MYMSVISTLRWWQCLSGDTVRYKDVTNRPVAAPTFPVNRNTALGTGSVLFDMLLVQQRPRWLRQMLSSYQSEVLVMRPADSRRPYNA